MDKLLPSQERSLQYSSELWVRQHQDFAKTLELEQQRVQERSRSRAHAEPTVSAGDVGAAANAVAPATGGNAEAAARAQRQCPVCAAASLSTSMGKRVSTNSKRLPNAVSAQDQTRALTLGVLPGQLTWSRIFPEHLIAGGYLSVLETATNHVQEASGERTSPALGMATGDVVTVGRAEPDRLNSVGGYADRATAVDTATLLVSGAEAIKSPMDDADRTLPVRTRVVAELADQFWAERLVRLTRDSDGRGTVWLRDFGLGEAGLESTVTALKQAVQRGGTRVDRIVINGREVWRACATDGGSAYVG